MVIFFQDLGLSYAEIFWVLTGGSMLSFFIEIPTGVIADLYGKRKSIIISKFIIALAFIAFGLAGGFWTLLLSNLIYELGKSFRSGTETAYVYDYLDSDKTAPKYTRVKAGQKFYARLSESIATAAGGFLATLWGFNFVFFLAAIPAGFNFIQTLTWKKIPEHHDKRGLVNSLKFIQRTFKTTWNNPGLPVIIINVALFTSSFVALATFVQPYMQNAGLPLKWFGLVYSGFLIIAAFLARFSSNLEKKFGGAKVMNVLTLGAVVPLIILGLGHVSFLGIGLFFIVLLVENMRSPIANSIFHERVESKQRATAGSILSLAKTAVQIALLPAIGYFADAFDIYTAILILAIPVLITGTIFHVRKTKPIS